MHDRANDERFQIAARYLVDCSGGRTVIRPALGIEMSGSPYVGYFLSIFVRAPELWAHHAMGKAALVTFVDAKGLWRNLVSLDGRELYRLGVSGKAYYDAPEQVDAEALFREAIGKDVPHEILSVRRWSARNVVADRYRHGRIFLAGDAAHLNHPAAGLGLNTGLGRRRSISAGSCRRCSPAGAARGFWTATSRSAARSACAISVMPIPVTTANASSRRIPRSPWIRRQARKHDARWATISSRIQTKRVITDGLALGYQYAPSPIVLERRHRADAELGRRVSPHNIPRQPGAARLAFRRTLHHRPVRQRLHAAAARRGRPAAVGSGARLRRARRAARRS